MKEKNKGLWNGHRIKLLLEAMAEGVFILDANGRITYWNPGMTRITGYTEDESLGSTCGILNFNRCFDQNCPGDTKICGILKGVQVNAKKCKLRHRDGYDVPVLKNARLIKESDGTIIGVVETVTDISQLKKAERQVEEATRRLGERHQFGNIIGKSHEMQEVFVNIKKAAKSSATVLIQGDSGTGKELVAGAIHYHSDRKDESLVTVNCSALSETLLESELFGHVRGAFTGAVRDRVGRFKKADGGTIFLDEISEVSPFIQLKLLRVLQEREFERVGETKKQSVDIRIIAATNRDLYEMVRDGSFREDLYYRLKVFPIFMPPLRHRKKDIPLLMSHFIKEQNKKTSKRIRGVSHDVVQKLMDYPWPGNVRELENAVEHAFVLCQGDQIEASDLPLEIRGVEYRPLKSIMPDSSTASLRQPVTRAKLLELLEACDWNKAEVARRLGLSRTAIWKYMKKWNIPLQK